MPVQGSGTTGGAAGTKMTPSDASRIQAAQAKAGGDAKFPARAQAAAARNAAATSNAAPAASAKAPRPAK